MSVESESSSYEKSGRGFFSNLGKATSHVSATVWGALKGVFTVGALELGIMAAGVPIPGLVSLVAETAGMVGGVINENKKTSDRYK